MAKRNTTINAGMTENAYEAGMRMRQGAYRAEEMHKKRKVNPGPRKIIPIWRALFNLACGVVLIVVISNRLDKVPHIPPSVEVNHAERAQIVEDARNGEYKDNGFTPMSEKTRRAAFGIR